LKAVRANFARRIIRWQKKTGRHNLPWQSTRDPYRIWLSEVMLQQTQVGTVIPYYRRFLGKFPTVNALARAKLDSVLALWSGLGYYARARNLHKAAHRIVNEMKGRFPSSSERLRELPGIGRSTAAAIAVFAHGERAAILDGNVKRVLTRFFGFTGAPEEKELWVLSEALLPGRGIEAYTQGMMDLGAGVCTRNRPACRACPLNNGCRSRDNPTVRRKTNGKTVPLRHCSMGIIMRNGRVLLEKRPARGVWGGLWSLPEALDGTELRRTTGSRMIQTLPAFTHSFTHFKLRITPHLLEFLPGKTSAGRLFTKKEALNQGIPAPVRRLLNAIPFQDLSGGDCAVRRLSTSR